MNYGRPMPSATEMLIVGAVILLLFGGAKLPQLARSLGSARSEFEKGLKRGAEDDDDTESS